ncbi:MAG TPA: glycosyltransferase family 2 protein [Candidatus Limnocylindrales bacterium]|nr:glycosyltransferase family 2 protein [Candidatus Limnocylindrales bacterium]
MNNLSVVLATFNEETNIEDCLESVKNIAAEIIIVDGSSTDKTVEIAKKYDATIVVTDNPQMFHINKQKALELAKNDWVLQLDADERVSRELADEIVKVINMPDEKLELYQDNLPSKKLFQRHQHLLKKRDGNIGTEKGSYVAFFIPRLNYFLGKYLRFGGVYPDGVIRLVKRQKAHFPCVSVHEQIEINGRVGWLENALYHIDSPTFSRYLQRNNRYTDLLSIELRKKNLNSTDLVNYLFILPISWFLKSYIRHKGFMDGWPGFVFSFFSSLRFPISYIKSLKK